MGWLYGWDWDNPAAVRKAINEGAGLKLVDQKATNYGRHLWSVYELPNGRRFINLDLIQKHDGRWGYKDMDECTGPCIYDCPLSLIEKAGPNDCGPSNRWRAAVRDLHERSKRKLTVNVRFTLWGHKYQVIDVDGQKITVRREDNRVFRLSKSARAALEIINEEVSQ